MSLSLKISIEKKAYYPGESIPVKMVLKNDSGKSKVIPAFNYNSDLTELIILDSSGEQIARLNDMRRQELMEYFPLEIIDPPDDSLPPGDERGHEMDAAQYFRLIKPGKYQLQGSYKFYDQTFLSDPLEIEILEGKASMLRHAWQYMLGEKWRCHLVYRDGEQIMHTAGESHSPEVVSYNLPVETDIKFDRFSPARSAFDDEEGYHPWLVGAAKENIAGVLLDGGDVLAQLGTQKIKGDLAEFAAVETYERRLVIPELLTENNKHFIVLHVYDNEGKPVEDKTIEVGAEAKIFDAAVYGDDEFQKYLLVYGQPADKGFDVYAVVSEKDDLSDLKSIKLYESERIMSTILIPPKVDESNEIFGAAFFPPAKELWIYNIGLDPRPQKDKPPKQVLETKGELEFLNMAVDARDLKYLLFVEDGKKLLYYDFANNEFRFITEEKFADAQLVVTPSDGIFLAFIDHNGLIQFRHTETVVKKH